MNFSNCVGLHLCSSFSISQPTSRKTTTLYRQYLETVGYPEGKGLAVSLPLHICAVDLEKDEPNTAINKETFESVSAILMGAKSGENWRSFLIDKAYFDGQSFPESGRINFTFKNIEEASDIGNKVRELNV